jgi:nicotinate-nucleotide adenylyltransferase
MKFLRSLRPHSRRIALYSGAFHPPTIAHQALAEAALEHADEVVFVLPEFFPHKSYDGAPLPWRARMLLEMGKDAVAISGSGLYFDIAAELQASLPGHEILILTGEDAARRIVEWDYGDQGEYLSRNLARHPILAARREGLWTPPAHLPLDLRWLKVPDSLAAVSSSEIRRRIATQGDWRPLVPATLHQLVEQLYCGSIVTDSGQ